MSERDDSWLMGALAGQGAYRGDWPEEYGPPAPPNPWAASMARAKEVGRSLVDMARTAPGHAGRGLMSGIASLGVPPDPIPFGDTSEEFDQRGLEGAQTARKELEAATYEPQTMAGHYMGSVAEIMGNPLNWAGPGGAAAKAGFNIASGVGGEAGAQAAKGTPYEGAARLAGSFSPLALERGWQATGPLVRAMPESVGVFGGKMIQPQPRMGELAQPFYSAAEQAVTGAKTPQAPAAQWLGTLRNAPGVKPEELQRLGVEGWLAQQGGPVSRQALQDYVAANRVNLGEVRKLDQTKPAAQRVNSIDDRLHDIQNEFDRLHQFNNPAATERRALLAAQERDLRNERADIVANWQDQASGRTKFSTYQLPGGENYRETLLTLPNKGADAIHARMNEIETMLRQPDSMARQTGPVLRDEYKRLADQLQETQTFSGSHWDEPNVLAHYRTNDRTIDGKKTLFLEEVQSDWHQKGRKQGYRKEPTDQEVLDYTKNYVNSFHRDPTAWDSMPPDAQAMRLEGGREQLMRQGVPDAPFKTIWPELALKRAIRDAAEGGYDQIAWTPGKVQVERYPNELRRTVSNISWSAPASERANPEGLRYVYATPTTGGLGIRFAVNRDGLVTEGAGQGKHVEEIFGKEMAGSIMGNPEGEIAGKDFVIGGKGMGDFYDKMLPAAANKIGKKHGAEVGQAEMQTNPAGWHITPPDQTTHGKWMVKSSDYNSRGFRFDSKEEAEANLAQQIAGERGGAHTVHTLPITPQLREQALRKGFPLFQLGAGGAGLGALAAQDRYQPNEL